MSTAIISKRPVLVDRLGATSVLANIAYVAGGVALLALAAQVQIPMFPVPITGQTFAVLAIGASFGIWRALTTTASYIALAVVGLPILAPGVDGSHTVGLTVFSLPTFGYLIGFVLASVVLGWFAERQWERKFLPALASFVIAEAVIYAAGLPWLAVWLGAHSYPNSLSAVLAAGFTPYLIGDGIKALLAAGLLPLSWKIVGSLKK